MSAPLNLPWVSALGMSLVHFFWLGCLVWAISALLLRLARHSGPRARYAIALTGLMACGLIPALDFAGRLGGAKTEVVQIIPPPVTSPTAGFKPALDSGATSQSFESLIQPYLSWVVLAWSLGALLLALRTCSGIIWIHGIRNRDLDETPAHWHMRLAQLADRLHLNRLPELKVSRLVDCPMVVGWWRPVVLLPAAAMSGMDPLLLEALLAHELAHIKRLDYLVNLLQHALEMLLFYHPAIWWLSRQVRMERELICDELAAGILGEPRRLALALKELDHFQLMTHQLAQAAHGGNLMKRIRNLIQPDLRPLPFRSWFALGTGALLILAGGILVARPKGPETQAKPESRSEKSEHPHRYALSIKGQGETSVDIDRRHQAEIRHLQTKLDKDLYWFQEGGSSYCIDDPAVVAKIRAAFKPSQDLGQEMGRLGGEMGEIGGKMGDLGGKMGEIGGQLGAVGGRMGDLGGKLANLHAKLSQRGLKPEERERIESQIEDVEAQMDRLEEDMEETEAAQKAPMKDLERGMAVHEKTMQELEKKMDALGKQLEAANVKAEAEVAKLIQEARQAGKVAKVSEKPKPSK